MTLQPPTTYIPDPDEGFGASATSAQPGAWPSSPQPAFPGSGYTPTTAAESSAETEYPRDDAESPKNASTGDRVEQSEATAPVAGSMAQAAGGVRPSAARTIPPGPRLSPPPFGMDVVGGTTVQLNRVVALDPLASGYGFLTVEWPVHQRGHDLLCVFDQARVSARANSLAIDVSGSLGRILIATGTRGTTQLAPSQLRITNGSTTILVPIDGGTSLGVWPRLSISKVGEYVVIRHEKDPLSGTLTAVSAAYGYDERNFLLAKS